MKRLALTLALLILILLTLGLTFKRTQWEYHQLYLKGDPKDGAQQLYENTAVARALKEMGDNGWELVQFNPDRPATPEGVYTFKRQR